jgi:DNA polymerase/3'-5' exonuclease PolX
MTGQPSESLLARIIEKLQSTGYITDHLSTSPTEYHGIVQLPSAIFSSTDPESQPPPHRRLCFRLVPWDSFVFYELHYTGSEAFTRHVREQAAKLGYRLTAEKLEKRTETAVEVFGVDALRFLEREKDGDRKEGECVLLDSEEDIFRFLRMKYIPPHSRNWY